MIDPEIEARQTKETTCGADKGRKTYWMCPFPRRGTLLSGFTWNRPGIKSAYQIGNAAPIEGGGLMIVAPCLIEQPSFTIPWVACDAPEYSMSIAFDASSRWPAHRATAMMQCWPQVAGDESVSA